MTRNVFIIAVLMIGVHHMHGQSRAEAPNVIVILADDLGWADLACYGNTKIQTPNLDRLAKEGMRFTNAYAPSPICSPSRAALLTGKSPARLQFEFVSKPDNSEVPSGAALRQPDYPRDLPLDEVTLAEVLPAYYKTGFFGKWHLTQENDTYLGWGDSMGPLQQGFMRGSESRGSHPYGYTKQEMKSFGTYAEGEYPADALSDAVVDFLGDNKENPFLLYYSMYYVHTPVRTRSRWLYDKYKKRYGPEASDDIIQYGAFVETMDAYVGRLLQALDDLGLSDNTVVIFTSDNGGHPRYTDNGKLRGSKWNLYEGGIRVPMIVRWPGVVKEGTITEVPVIGMDIFPTVAAIAASKEPSYSDGLNLVPMLRGSRYRKQNERTLYWHFPFYHPQFVDTKPQSAIREGAYKLIYYYEDNRTELYDLEKDPGEEYDLSEDHHHPGRVNKLKEKLFAYLKQVNARVPEKK